MVPILLALMACAAFGISDYLQGMAARKASSIPVMVVAQNAGLFAIAIAAPLLGGMPSQPDLIWGGVLGVLLLGGIALLIYSFSHGPITIASTVIAIFNLAVPAFYGLLMGQQLSLYAWIGLGLALVAIAMVNFGKRQGSALNVRSLAASIASGTIFGCFSIVMSRIGPDAGLWPLLVGYLVRGLLLCIVVAVLKPPRLMQACRTVLPIAGLAGVMVTFGGAAYLLSLQLGGHLIVMSTISSEAPVFTVVLAMIFIHERVNPIQATGLVAGFASLILMGL